MGPPMDARLDELARLLGDQQSQLDSLGRQHATLLEKSAAMLECLEDSGVVKEGVFLARLHRRRFARVLRQHPCECRESFETVLQTREMTVTIARLCGPECTTALTAASRAFSRRVDEAQAKLSDLFSPAVYVVGGEGTDEDVTGVVERFDPVAGGWELVAPLPSARAYCAAVALAGQLYVLGGSDADGAMLSSVDRYDPRQDLWEPMPPMQSARVAVAAVTLDACLCAVGGNNEIVVHDSVEVFDPAACGARWMTIPRMRSPRWAAAAAAIGRHLYVIGGRDSDDEVLSAVERFDLEAPGWRPLPPLRTPRASFAAAAVSGVLYVVGGYDTSLQDLRSLERFDPSVGAWQQLTPMGAPRFALGALSCRGCLYALGGAAGDVDRVVLGTVELYDPQADLWLSASSLRTPRRRFGVAACRLV